jgi:hypothetical protein
MIHDADASRGIAKAINFSDRSMRRTGSPSATNSEDLAAGIQNWRINSPMGVPGPVFVRISFSTAVVMSGGSPRLARRPRMPRSLQT